MFITAWDVPCLFLEDGAIGGRRKKLGIRDDRDRDVEMLAPPFVVVERVADLVDMVDIAV